MRDGVQGVGVRRCDSALQSVVQNAANEGERVNRRSEAGKAARGSLRPLYPQALDRLLALQDLDRELGVVLQNRDD